MFHIRLFIYYNPNTTNRMSYKLECRISIDEVVIITNDKMEIVNDKDSMYSLGVLKYLDNGIGDYRVYWG